MIISPNIPQLRAIRNDGGSAPAPTITVRETGWMHIDLQWTNDKANWYDPCILQRKTSGNFPTPNLSGAQDPETNFIWIGINDADQYIDLGLDEGTIYHYRVAYVTNWPDVVRSSATPTYTDWQYGVATTMVRDAAISVVRNVVDDFGADNTGATNSWDNFQSAFASMTAAGGGELYVPAGTYTVYPTDPAVVWDGTHLSVTKGDSYASNFISGQTSNFVIRGDVDGSNNPTTFINCRLWHNRPATESLNIMKIKGGGDPSNDDDVADVRRYGFWRIGDRVTDVENAVFKNIEVDMTAVPVSTGKAWYTLEDKRTQWDISHKFIYGHNNARNIFVQNTIGKNCRGEMCYWGGYGCEKYKMENVTLSQSNSSIISMSANAEYVDCDCSDCSNSGIESAAHSLSGENGSPQLTSPFSGLTFRHDTIIRGCTFTPMDRSVNGVMKDLGDLGTTDNAFDGIHVFNQVGTICTITDTTVRTWRNNCLGPWIECFNSFANNLTLDDPDSASTGVFSFQPFKGAAYGLSGGQDKTYWGNINITLNGKSINNSGGLFWNISHIPAQSDLIIDKVDIDGEGGIIRRLMVDKFTETGRERFKFRDWTFSNLSTDEFNFVWYLNNNIPVPQFTDMGAFWNSKYVNASDLTVDVRWSHTQLTHTGTLGSAYNVEGITNIEEHSVGSELKFKPVSSGHSITFKADPSWNTFTQDYTFTGSQVLTCTVTQVGTNKLQYVSLA